VGRPNGKPQQNGKPKAKPLKAVPEEKIDLSHENLSKFSTSLESKISELIKTDAELTRACQVDLANMSKQYCLKTQTLEKMTTSDDPKM
jgi:hypothetical protein